MHQVAGDAVFLQHHGDGLRGVEGRVALAAALGVGDERLLELIGEAEVVHHQPAGLVEAGQPHVPHDDDLEGVFRVLEPSRLAGGETDCRQAARRANPPRGGG